MPRLARIGLLCGLTVALLGACETSADKPPPPQASDEAEDQPGIGLPATPAGSQLTWVLTDGATADDQELARRFSSDFLAAVPVGEVRTVLSQVGRATAGEVRRSEPTTLEVIVESAGGTSVLARITVDAAAPNRITGLIFQPAASADPPTTWAEVDTALAGLAARASLLAAEVTGDGSLVAIHEREPDAAGPIGSIFKLYVLGALSEAVTDGSIAWDERLVIKPTDASLPSGRLQDEVGSAVTVREAAQLMISISDNTATDLLIGRLGRRAVEDVLEPMGLGPASRAATVPFLRTRELFILKWGQPRAAIAAYAGADERERRRLLEALPSRLPRASRVDPAHPVEVDRIEWFASPRELAAAHLFLDGRRVRPGLEPVGGILGQNRGVDLDAAVWARVAFKGGSEPGVLALSWLLERADGRRFVVNLLASDTARAVDEGAGAAIGAGAIALLAGA